ncbi:MAG: hypothetical protein OSB19_14085 [Opitutaceae bacterium]|nr:hypothetical protein [Opitutaceae bacterium]
MESEEAPKEEVVQSEAVVAEEAAAETPKAAPSSDESDPEAEVKTKA